MNKRELSILLSLTNLEATLKIERTNGDLNLNFTNINYSIPEKTLEEIIKAFPNSNFNKKQIAEHLISPLITSLI